jgi:hypothetical protein
MHDRFKLLLQSNTGLSAALSYSRSRPPINLVPLFDCLDDQQADALMHGGGSRTRWGSQVSNCAAPVFHSISVAHCCIAWLSLTQLHVCVICASSCTPAQLLPFAVLTHYNIPMLPTQDPKNKAAPRCHWRVFYPEQLMASAGGAITDVIVVTKGAVRMRFPPTGAGQGPVKPHTVVASVGECRGGGRLCSTLAAVR